MPPKQIAAEYKRRLLAEFGDLIVSVILFGSVARGDDTSDSDIDVLVVFRDETDIRERWHRARDVAGDVSLEFDTLIGVLPASQEGFENWCAKDAGQMSGADFDVHWQRREKPTSVSGCHISRSTYIKSGPRQMWAALGRRGGEHRTEIPFKKPKRGKAPDLPEAFPTKGFRASAEEGTRTPTGLLPLVPESKL